MDIIHANGKGLKNPLQGSVGEVFQLSDSLQNIVGSSTEVTFAKVVKGDHLRRLRYKCRKCILNIEGTDKSFNCGYVFSCRESNREDRLETYLATCNAEGDVL